MTIEKRKFLPVAVGVACIAFWALSFAPLVNEDDMVYIVMAKSLLETGRLSALQVTGAPLLTHQPLLSILMVPVIWLFPEFPSNLVPLVAVLCFGLGCLWLALLWRLLQTESLLAQPERVGVCLLTAFNFTVVPYVAGWLLTESLYLLITLSCLLLLQRYEQERQWLTPAGCTLGIALAAAYHTRTVGLMLIVAVVLYLAVHGRQLRKASLLFVVASGLMVPWMVRNYTLGVSLIGGRYSEVMWRRDFWNPAAGRVEHPLELVVRVFSNARDYATEVFPELFAPGLTARVLKPYLVHFQLTNLLPAVGVLCAVLVLVGFVASLRQRRGVLHAYVPLYFLMVALAPWINIRNWVPVLPFLWIWLVLGLGATSDLLARGGRRLQVLGVLVRRMRGPCPHVGRAACRRSEPAESLSQEGAGPLSLGGLPPFWTRRSEPAEAGTTSFGLRALSTGLVLGLLLIATLVRDVEHLRHGAAFRRQGVLWVPREQALARAAAWIQSHTPPEAMVFHSQPQHLFLYTGRKSTPFHASNDTFPIFHRQPGEVMAELYGRFDYVLRRSDRDHIPGLVAELERGSTRLQPIYNTGGDPHITVYRIVRER